MITGFEGIFNYFLENKDRLKVMHVASCDQKSNPNSAPKMLMDIQAPNKVFFLDYQSTKSYAFLQQNPKLSLSFMDDAAFQGYRLTGIGKALEPGEEYGAVKKEWDQRLIRYETDRILNRMNGHYSAKVAEMALPPNFIIIKFTAEEGSLVEPGRVLRVYRKHK